MGNTYKLNNNLYSFFSSKGYEVIDNRAKGGCLWVVGFESELEDIVDAACNRFGIDGYYSIKGGRASGHRPAWFTTASK